MRYQPRGGDAREYRLRPLALVVREPVIYLVTCLWDYDDPVHLPLHRFRTAQLLDTPSRPPPDFDLDDYIASGELAYPVAARPLKLDLLFAAQAAHHLGETVLGADQSLTEQADGRVRVRATVADTQELRWWLRGFGAAVEVRKPLRLRREFAAQAEALGRLYGGGVVGG